MIHSYDMSVALAEQHRRQLLAEADGRRLVRLARRARKAATNAEPVVRSEPADDVVDLTAIADLVELVDAGFDGQGQSAPCR